MTLFKSPWWGFFIPLCRDSDAPLLSFWSAAVVTLNDMVVILERSEESLAAPIVTLNEVKGLLL